MDWLNIIAKIFGIFVGVAVVVVAPRIENWLKTKMDADEYEQMSKIISTFVEAAQQTLWKETGAARKEYVISQLVALGYEVSDEINALIEAKVYSLHQEASDGK